VIASGLGASYGKLTDRGVRIVQEVSPTLRVGAATPADGGPGDTVPIVVSKTFVKTSRAREKDGLEKWQEEDVAPTVNLFDASSSRAVTLVQQETAHTVLGKPNSSHAADMDTYVVAATLNSGGNDGGFRTEPGEHLIAVDPITRIDYDPLLPDGLDSHRYRCCGNGVVAPVTEWIGQRLADALME